MPFEEDDKDASIWFLDHNYHETMFDMFKRINGILTTSFLQLINFFVVVWMKNAAASLAVCFNQYFLILTGMSRNILSMADLLNLFVVKLTVVRRVCSAKEHVVGWYSTGPKLRENDLDINELFRE